jgi:hypothetical protein
MPFDQDMRPDIHSVLDAAAILDITEIELFRLAYQHWYGERVDEKALEPFFVAYMFNDVVPLWVRYFSRLVQRRSQLGTLDSKELGVDLRLPTPQMVRRGTRYVVTLVTVMAALIVLAEIAAQLMNLGERCMFPPCY